MPDNGSISVEITNNIGTLTFHHPKGNSLPGRLLEDMANKITELGENNEVRVILLQSKGEGAFCAGASFTELTNIEDFVAGKQFFMGFAKVINAMRKAPTIVVARVQGKAVGGGVGLASAADYTLAAEGASVKLSELALGIGPFVVGPAVKRKIGPSAFGQLAINATEWREASWARRHGLYADLYDSIEALDEGVRKLTSQLAGSSPEALEELKKMLWEDTEDWDQLLEERAEISGRLVLSDYTRQAISAFKKR